MAWKFAYVAFFGILLVLLGLGILQYEFPVGSVILLGTVMPLSGILIVRRSMMQAIPDLVFGAIDTGLLVIPALLGGLHYGVGGAIAGGVVGDALTDGIAGFFEGGIAKWLRDHGIEESREPVITALGKMAGCLLGSGLILTFFLLFGIEPPFGVK